MKAIPLGGYIAMIGMFPPAKGEKVHADSTGFFRGLVQDARDSSMESITTGDEDRAFYRLPVWKRIVVMFGGPFMNLVLAIVLFGVLLMGFGIGAASTTVGSVSACALPATSERQTCEAGDPAAPGAAAGLEPGDRIVSVAGQPIDDLERSPRRSSATTPTSPSTWSSSATATRSTLMVTPMLSERYETRREGPGRHGCRGRPGHRRRRVRRHQPGDRDRAAARHRGAPRRRRERRRRRRDHPEPAAAHHRRGERRVRARASATRTGRSRSSASAASRARSRAIDEIPLASKAAGLIGILASLNIALFVFNLIPLLPLDGGHIAGALWEAHPPRIREALPPARSGARRPGEAHAAHARRGRRARRHERAAHLRRHREAGDAPLTRRRYSRGSSR